MLVCRGKYATLVEERERGVALRDWKILDKEREAYDWEGGFKRKSEIGYVLRYVLFLALTTTLFPDRYLEYRKYTERFICRNCA